VKLSSSSTICKAVPPSGGSLEIGNVVH